MEGGTIVQRARVRTEVLPAVLFGFVPLLLLVLITALQLYRNVPAAETARIEAATLLGTVRLANDIERVILDAERAQRGYLLTGRVDYLGPYASGRERLPSLLDEFELAVSGRPDDLQRLRSLRANLAVKLDQLARSIDARRTDDEAGVRRIVESADGHAAMTAIGGDLGMLRDAARERFQRRLAAQAELQDRLTLTFLAGTAIAAFALLMGGIFIARAYIAGARSQGLLQATLDSVREGVLALDRSGTVQASSASMAEALGPAAAAIVVRRPLPGVALGGGPDATLASVVAGLHDEVVRTGRSVLVERVDHRGRTLEIFHGPAFDGGSVTTFVDVTEQRAYAEVVRQAQKLEALGQMTGGLAHDFNNLLMVITGNVALLQRSLRDDPRAQKRIELLGSAADRGARLTRQLLAFARRQPLEPVTVHVGRLIPEMLPLVRDAAGAGVEVALVEARGLWNATLDANQLQAALINLAINARDAMPGGGPLTLDVANAVVDSRSAERHPEVVAGEYVAVAATDTGRGMDAATVARAFDPFFTTKRTGDGSGLGLAQVYGFVKQSGGFVRIDSTPGEGTTVTLYFPRSVEPLATQQQAAAPVAGVGRETILVVDDDHGVRVTVSSLLEDLGYTVLGASSGEDGLALFEDRADEIDLLFTDVVMPGAIGGRELADRIKRLRPALPILFTSGYAQDAIVHNGRLDAGVELLSKPYDPERLAARLRRMLDAAAATGRVSPDGSTTRNA